MSATNMVGLIAQHQKVCEERDTLRAQLERVRELVPKICTDMVQRKFKFYASEVNHVSDVQRWLDELEAALK